MKFRVKIMSVFLCCLIICHAIAFPGNADEENNNVLLNDGFMIQGELKRLENTDGFTITSVTFCGKSYDAIENEYAGAGTDNNLTYNSSTIKARLIYKTDGSVFIVAETDSPRFIMPQNAADMFFYPSSNYSIGFDNIEYISVASDSSMDSSNVTTFQRLFASCSSFDPLRAPEGETPFFTCLDSQNVTTCQEMFRGCMALTILDLSFLDLSKCKDMPSMFLDCKNLMKVTFPTGEKGPAAAVEGGINDGNTGGKGLDNMFSDCEKLWEVDLSSFRIVSSNTRASNIFNNCSSLTRILVNEDTFPPDGFANDMSGMFSGCRQYVLLGGEGSFLSSKDCGYVLGGPCISGGYGKKYGKIDTPSVTGLLTSVQRSATLTFDVGNCSVLQIEMPVGCGGKITYPSELGAYHVIYNKGKNFWVPDVKPFSEVEGAFVCWKRTKSDGSLEYYIYQDVISLEEDTTFEAVYCDDPSVPFYYISIPAELPLQDVEGGNPEGMLRASVGGYIPQGSHIDVTVNSGNEFKLIYAVGEQSAEMPYELLQNGIAVENGAQLGSLSSGQRSLECTARITETNEQPGTYTDTLTFTFDYVPASVAPEA